MPVNVPLLLILHMRKLVQELADRKKIIAESELLLSINPPVEDDIKSFREGQVLCSVLNPVANSVWLEKARLQGLSVLALDLIPRTTRAQSMDILSSMATVSGYKAVLEAASLLPRFFPMFMSAAGTIKPSQCTDTGCRSCRVFRLLPLHENLVQLLKYSM